MKNIHLYLFAFLYGLCQSATVYAQQGSMTVENSTVTIYPGTTEMRFSQETYFGPETDWTVDGTLEIWSEKVWISPTAKISGSGTLYIHSPGDNPFYEDWSAAQTLIDCND